MNKSIAILLGITSSFSVLALDYFPSRGGYNVKVKSYQEQLFGDVLRQQYDFSCGSAAVASLMTFHYDIEINESEVFDFMFKHGDKEKIEKQGFSLLDMKKYINSIGLEANGYKLPLEKIKKLGIPAITIINFDGYMHFVVIKGINTKQVILGDPSRGTIVMDIKEFEEYYKGLVLLVKSHIDVARNGFIKKENYSVYAASPTAEAVSRDSLATFSITLPGANDY
ncbi:C39 family peptidase [Photobacterium swingsii]|uniref:Bacteriocin resistance protein n=1 Tax=Photobacterium swingsii TaxID=680026 RepID=A0A0J8Y184_9GAMM|nr:C39 family peptidase [Photobacterium swingsii]KMV31389.1 bacteriocin resistance protein [Photobacterium swingsii]PSW25109.1 bacteriocin resistance protein [Photobacterium swingsii]